MSAPETYSGEMVDRIVTQIQDAREMLIKQREELTAARAAIATLHEVNLKYRDAILKVVADCPTCGGAGRFGVGPMSAPCPDCSDLRKVLNE